MKTKLQLLAGAAATFCAAGLASTVHAQQTAPQSAQAAPGSGLEEIVVTARRREEAIQTVPVAITAVTQELIREQKIVSFWDLQQFVPGLREANIAARRELDQINIRSAPGSVQYFSEAPVFTTGTFYDLANVQIVKGPQGTLFGGNNSGGAVLISPRRPNVDAYEGYVDVSFGNLSSKELEGAVNVPILPGKFAIRISAKRNERDGFTEDVGPINTGKKYDNRDDWSWRVGATFKPTEWFEDYVVWSGYYRHTNSTGNKMFAFDPNGQTARVFGVARTQQVVDQQNAIGPRKTALSTVQRDVQSSSSIVNVAQAEIFENLTIKDIFGMSWNNTVDNYDFDGSVLASTDRIDQQGWRGSTFTQSNELNAQASFFNDKLKLTGGWYYEGTRPNEKFLNTVSVSFGALPTNLTEGGHGNKRDTHALYGQATYDLGGIVEALDGLSVNGGLRRVFDHQYDQVTFGYNRLTGACQNKPGTFFPNCLVNLPEPPKTKLWNWSVGADYQITQDLLAYVSIRRNNLTGSTVTDPIIRLPAFTNIAPQSFQDWEVGIKKDWNIGGAPARTNIAYYRTKWKNITRSVGVFNPCDNRTGGANRNAGTALLEGIEFDGQLQPTPDVNFYVNYAWSAPRYLFYNAIDLTSLQFNCTTGAVSFSNIPLKGLAFGGNPRHKINLTGRYTLPFIDEDKGKVSVQATYTYQVAYWASSADTGPFQVNPAFYLINMRADWKGVAGYPLDVGFYVNNLTDNTFVQSQIGAIWNAFGFVQAFYNEPRTYGIQLTYHFGPGH